MRGAIREDDVPSWAGSNPQDDPVSSIFRVFSHFYDPINNAPLTVAGIRPGSAFGDPNEPAPGWALGSQNVFASPVQPDANRRNHFTVFDAREALYRALTGRDASGKSVAVTEDERNKYWATTFRALGDVVHLLQDMGQPQHTRNEAHCGRSYNFTSIPGCGHKSVYETYIEARATQSNFVVRNLFGQSVVDLPTTALPLNYGDIDAPGFSNYVSFFSTRNVDSDIFSRRGLADYSNRGFFTAAKNLGNGDYAFPVNNPSNYLPENLSENWIGNPLPNNASVTLLSGMVSDSVNPLGSKVVPLSTQGLWDQFLVSKGFFPSYTLTKKNYDAMADLLIPRAVAYSAGIINYFFRGKLDFVADTNNAGAYLIKNLGPEAMSGDFTLYYDAADGKRYPVAGDQPTKTWASRTIANNGQLGNLSFSVPANPAPEVPGKYMLVFNGDMGEEKAVPGSTVGAVAAKYVEPERSGFLIQPNFATADGITGPRLIYWDGAQWKLSKEKGLLAGNVDWKGWYVNGKPTKVLSWMGPASRYGLNDSAGSFSPNIYQNGSMFAVAPNPVLGAALIKDGNGLEWLVAIGSAGGNVVFIRPNKKKLSAALYDSVKNPEGWRLIGKIEQDVVVGKSWSFNGGGNEAQVVSAPDGDKARRKVNIQFAAGGSAQAVFTSIPYVSANLYSDIHNKPDPVIVDNFSACAGGHFSTYYKNTRIDEYSHWEGYTWLLAVDYSDNSEILAEQHIKYGHNDQFIKIDEISREIFNNPPECDWTHAPTQNYLPEVVDGSDVRKSFGSRTENVQMNGVKVPISPQESNSSESKVWHAVTELRCFLGQCETIKTIANNFSETVSVISEGNAYYLELPDIRGGSSIVYRQSRKDVDSALPIYSELLEVNSGGGKNAYALATQVGIPNQCLAGVCQGFGKLPYTPSGYQAGFGQDLSGHILYLLQVPNQIVAPVGKKAFFNFLSGGSIEALIPYGSSDASYSYIGLIK